MKIFIKLAIIFLVIHKSQQKSSPCPKVFSYNEKDDTADTWFGTLKLHSNVPLHGIFIDVIFDATVYDFGTYFKDVTTKNNLQFHIEDKTYNLNAGETLILKFYVKFQSNYRVPLLKQIRFNGQNVCIDLPVPVEITTKAYQDNIYYPDTNRKKTETSYAVQPIQPINQNGRQTTKSTTKVYDAEELYSTIFNVRFSGDEEIIVPPSTKPNNSGRTDEQKPSIRTTTVRNVRQSQDDRRTTTPRNIPTRTNEISTTPRNLYFQGDFAFLSEVESTTHHILSYGGDICGTVIPKTNALVVHGQLSQSGQFPWHGAVYRTTITELKYLCGATLISSKIAITAAHCVTLDKTKQSVEPDNLLIYLGKHNLRKWTGPEQDAKVQDIFIHPDYNYERFFADIAILRFTEDVKFNNFIRPACLWNFDEDYKVLINKVGHVPGWGYNERGLVSEELSFAQMPVVAHETCIWSNRDFFSKVTSNVSFCAGFKNGTSVCNGDSGGGLVFKQNNRWYLRGVVSVSAALQNTLKCDPNHYAVFTDVAKFLNWIKNLM